MGLALGCSAAAISKALSAGREILVTCHKDGTFTAEELRPFPSQQPQKKSAA
ncbi:Cro [compost metagenome]